MSFWALCLGIDYFVFFNSEFVTTLTIPIINVTLEFQLACTPIWQIFFLIWVSFQYLTMIRFHSSRRFTRFFFAVWLRLLKRFLEGFQFVQCIVFPMSVYSFSLHVPESKEGKHELGLKLLQISSVSMEKTYFWRRCSRGVSISWNAFCFCTWCTFHWG